MSFFITSITVTKYWLDHIHPVGKCHLHPLISYSLMSKWNCVFRFLYFSDGTNNFLNMITYNWWSGQYLPICWTYTRCQIGILRRSEDFELPNCSPPHLHSLTKYHTFHVHGLQYCRMFSKSFIHHMDQALPPENMTIEWNNSGKKRTNLRNLLHDLLFGIYYCQFGCYYDCNDISFEV